MKKNGLQKMIAAILALAGLAAAFTGCAGENKETTNPKDDSSIQDPSGSSTPDQNPILPVYSQGLAYTLSEDRSYAILTGVGTCTDQEVRIAPVFEGVPVKVIREDAFRDNKTVKKVIMPDSVEEIGKCAFYYASALEEIVFSENLKTLGKQIVGGQEKLKKSFCRKA